LMHEKDKLDRNIGGIKEMKKIPDVIFIVDPRKERIAVQEAHNLNITTVGIVDTNCDPEEIDHVIPGNDDAIRAVKLISSRIADAVIEARQGQGLDEEGSDESAE
ncbi:MAG: 30S ribosomal protein S2, partial [bacterium]